MYTSSINSYQFFYDTMRTKYGKRFVFDMKILKNLITLIVKTEAKLYQISYSQRMNFVLPTMKILTNNERINQKYYQILKGTQNRIQYLEYRYLKIGLNKHKNDLFTVKSYCIRKYDEEEIILLFGQLNSYKLYQEQTEYKRIKSKHNFYLKKKLYTNYNDIQTTREKRFFYDDYENKELYYKYICEKKKEIYMSRSNIQPFNNISSNKNIPLQMTQLLNHGPKHTIDLGFHDKGLITSKNDIEFFITTIVKNETQEFPSLGKLNQNQIRDLQKIKQDLFDILPSTYHNSEIQNSNDITIILQIF